MTYRNIFDDQAKHVVGQAVGLAREMRHPYLGSEHLLWALSGDHAGRSAEVLQAAGLSAALLRDMIEKYDGIGAAQSEPSVSPDTGRIFEIARTLAHRQGAQLIGADHLLLAVLSESGSAGCRMVTAAGVSPESLARDLMGDAQGEPVSAKRGEGGVAVETKTLDQFTRDLNAMAREGRLDPVIGRATEIQRVIQILSRRSKNNPVLIGEPGVGKTAVAEGLAQRIVKGEVPENLAAKRVVSLDLAKMLSGTKFRGDFEERIKNALDEILAAGDVILFIDEMHTLIGAGAAEGAMDAANIIKPALSRGELQVIGATTLDEYRKHIEKDAALERRFQPVMVDEPSQEDAVAILKGLRSRYEEHHKLHITDEAIDAAVTLSSRYIGDRFLPDKAIDLIDEAASRVRTVEQSVPEELRALENRLSALNTEKQEAVKYQDYERAAMLRDLVEKVRADLEAQREQWRQSGGGNVGEQDVAAVVAAWTGVPVTMLTEDESERLLRMEEILHRRVIGQDEAVAAVSKAIRRGRVGLKDPKRPTGSFLFLGPTGVGKTELCKALAEALFGDENAMQRVDMSEFMERHTVSKLIGSPPGYVGYDEGGQLTEKVRRKPYSVVLFDEIEKAHPDVWSILLQIMEDGILTDSQGRRIDFRNTVVVMTSNIGARNITERRAQLGFGGESGEGERSLGQIREAVMGDLRATFKPEFLNRIDDIIVFSQLSREDIRAIARGMLDKVAERIAAMGIDFAVDDSAVEVLADKGFDPVYGARPLRRTIQSSIEDAAAERILEGKVGQGGRLRAVAKDGEIAIEVMNKEAAEAVSV